MMANTIRMAEIARERFGSKGLAVTLELLTVIAALFVAYSTFFPARAYTGNWDDAYAVLMSRDTIASLVASGDLYSYMSDESAMSDFFDTMFPESNYVFWYSMEGTKDKITIACNCTSEQITKIDAWSDGLRMNDRDIDVFVCYTKLEEPKSTCMKTSDVLLTWGTQDLAEYEQGLMSYLTEDKGIVEIVDFPAGASPDSTQQAIFGITNSGVFDGTEDVMHQPDSTDWLTYGPFKYFYHMPLTLYAPENAALTECLVSMKGSFSHSIAGIPLWHDFWTCNGTYVFFDMNDDGVYVEDDDVGPLSEGDKVTLGPYDFMLGYVDSSNKIRMSFPGSADYKFMDFVQAPATEPVFPDDGDITRILVQMDGAQPSPACGVIVNGPYDSRTAWMADLGRGGLDVPDFTDDHRQLLLSLLVWSSRKRVGSETIPSIQEGRMSSYVEINNIDVFEIHKYEIGVGSPY
jgi:hypothetical protein